MRLLHISSRTFTEWPTNPPPYAILSHRWGDEDSELTYQDLVRNSERQLTYGPSVRDLLGYFKIEATCAQATEHGCQYVWVDTCCIDKSSSAELSEAITSMFSWYQDSFVCIVYLDDVLSYENPFDLNSSFRKSKWFTRGWTLQELIASPNVYFFAKDWKMIGTKYSLADVIHDITKIDLSVLKLRNLNLDVQLNDISIAKRMSWASQRKTKKPEDKAYALMGLFGVTMPVIYGEGGPNAFVRLQRKIMKVSHDQSLFAWGLGSTASSGLLAESPARFAQAACYVRVTSSHFAQRLRIGNSDPSYKNTNYGVSILLPLLEGSWTDEAGVVLAYLACAHDSSGQVPCIYLKPHPNGLSGHYIRVRHDRDDIVHMPMAYAPGMTTDRVFVETRGEYEREEDLPKHMVYTITVQKDEANI